MLVREVRAVIMVRVVREVRAVMLVRVVSAAHLFNFFEGILCDEISNPIYDEIGFFNKSDSKSMSHIEDILKQQVKESVCHCFPLQLKIYELLPNNVW